MNCPACSRVNLPGGVRCAYCGMPFAPALDFDLGTTAPSQPIPAGATPSQNTADATRPAPPRRTGLFGLLVLIALKGKSLLALLKFGKIATTLSSMLLFIWADALLFGWTFGVGIALCILIHEMGHVFVNWRKGLKQSAPMFIPFVGAVIFVKRFPDDPAIQSESGAGGPAAGMLAAFACLLIARMTNSGFWLALAHVGFVINLFNLVPFPPLDGSHIGTVFSPRMWDGVLIVLLLWAIKMPTPMLWMLLLVAFVLRLGRTDDGRHLLAPPTMRLRMAAVYLVLCIGLTWGAGHTTGARLPRTNASATVRNASPRPAISSGSEEMESASSDGAPGTGRRPMVITEARAQQLRWMFRGISSGLIVLLWGGTTYLLSISARKRFTPRLLVLPAVMLGVYLLTYDGSRVLGLAPRERLVLIGACWAAAFAALFHAAWRTVRLRHRRTRPPRLALEARTLAWAAGAALVVAYAAESAPVAVATALGIGLYYARYPWMVWSLLGSLAEQMGDAERSLDLRQQAVVRSADMECARSLWADIARLNLALARGSGALAALDARQEIGDGDLYARAAALALLDRYDEALGICERLLAIPGHDTESLRLLQAHLLLCDLAQLRDWPDETLAQAEWCLRAVPAKARMIRAGLHLARATALLDLDRPAEAQAAVEQALASSRESAIDGAAARLRAQIDLKAGDTAAAMRELARALRLLPGSLPTCFQRALALREAGAGTEAAALLERLADEFPLDHWGRRAREALTPV